MTLLAAALGAAACSEGVEHAVLSRFFSAARLRDRTALGAMATVDFNPAIDGVVTTFQVVDVGADERRPLSTADPAIVQLSLEELKGQPAPNASGDLVTRSVTIAAPVRGSSGETATRTMGFTLSRAELTAPSAITGQWIVSARSAPR